MNDPVAYVAVSNPARRAHIVNDLRRQGWIVLELPTGFHVLAALAEVIEGRAEERPAKIVIDAHARGCTGTSIAAGLAALGVKIAVELVNDQPPSPPPKMATTATTTALAVG